MFIVIRSMLCDDYDTDILEKFDNQDDAVKFIREYVINEMYDGDIDDIPEFVFACFDDFGNYNDGEIKLVVKNVG